MRKIPFIPVIILVLGYFVMATPAEKHALAHKSISPVVKHTLDNGMTVLVRPIHSVPKVSVQLWYNVGSKDEKDNERGIAHLIEHMIFKGTNTLSESEDRKSVV